MLKFNNFSQENSGKNFTHLQKVYILYIIKHIFLPRLGIFELFTLKQQIPTKIPYPILLDFQVFEN